MSAPEFWQHPTVHRSWGERFIDAVKKALRIKAEEDIHKEAKKAQRKFHEEETKEKRKREEEERKRREEEKKYNERVSLEELAERDLIHARESLKQRDTTRIKDQLDKIIQQPPPTQGKQVSGYEQSLYLFRDYLNNPRLLNQLKDLVDQNPRIAKLIDDLTNPDDGIHSNPTKLLLAGKLLYLESPQTARVTFIDPLIQAIKTRTENLIEKQNELIRRMPEDRRPIPVQLQVIDTLDKLLSDDQKRDLRDQNNWRQAIGNILTTDRTLVQTDLADALPTAVQANTPSPTNQAVREIDKIWSEVVQREAYGDSLSPDELKDVERKIFEKSSESYPLDVFPGTEAYRKQVHGIHRYTEGVLDKLSEKLRERLRSETPAIRKGVTNIDEFISLMHEHPGRVGDLLAANPEMKKLFLGTGTESQQFRNRVFLRIHAGVLSQKRESSNDNFGLYERADFTSFINILRDGLANLKDPKTGKPLGTVWQEWYTSLSTTIRLSRDIDFWASQPAANIENFNKSLALFQNEYSVQAMSIPAVEQAFRAYETSLRTIRDANDGYIPPALVEYDAINRTAYWDDSAERMLEQMMALGVVHDVKRDERTGLPIVDKDGNSILLGKQLTQEDIKKMDKLELQMYMTLAKGFGMASMRYLEYFANSKIPGSLHPELGMPGFHSIAGYEGVAMALNYYNMMIHKWKMGTYNYFHMVNATLPQEHRLPINEREAIDAYNSWVDGTFEERYGHEAKRIIDHLNFDRSTGAWGPPHTSWRHMDSTIGWTDRQRALLGGPTQIQFSGAFATAKVKEYYIIGKYREKYRAKLENEGLPTSGAEFDRLWKERGMTIFARDIDADWKKIQNDPKVQDAIKKYKKAFIARTWIETVMRNPLIVAHSAKIDVPNEGFRDDKDPRKRTRKISLHNLIVQKVLGITPEELQYGSVPEYDEHGNFTGRYKVSGAKYSSPTEDQRNRLNEVMFLEADLASVREIAIRENRELAPDDFRRVITNEARRKNAEDYWNICRQVMMGSVSGNRHNELYERFGLKLKEGLDYYDLDWDKIGKIDETIEHLHHDVRPLSLQTTNGELVDIPLIMSEKWIDKDWEWLIGTDDTSFRQMAMLNLGSRQWVRRGGDAGSHLVGGQKSFDYFANKLTPNPDVHDLAKALLEIRQAYEGDDIAVGWKVAGSLAHLTSRLYSWDWSELGSYAQRHVFGTRRGVGAWMANKRREFFDALEHINVIPPIPKAGLYPYMEDLYTIHELRKINHADNPDVWREIITLGLLIALAMTVYRALTAPSEEEEDGGGGGHH